MTFGISLYNLVFEAYSYKAGSTCWLYLISYVLLVLALSVTLHMRISYQNISKNSYRYISNHIYKGIWDAIVGETLQCKSELDNESNRYMQLP